MFDWSILSLSGVYSYDVECTIFDWSTLCSTGVYYCCLEYTLLMWSVLLSPRSILLYMFRYSGYRSCHWCKVEGRWSHGLCRMVFERHRRLLAANDTTAMPRMMCSLQQEITRNRLEMGNGREHTQPKHTLRKSIHTARLRSGSGVLW
jgi:hypothetical protein